MADNKRRSPWPVLVGDGLLLLCALPGFAGSFLSLYGGPNAGWLEAAALDRCAANGDLFLACAALFGLAALAVWSLPRYRGGLAGGLTALWAGAVLWNRAEVTHGLGVTVREITALFARRVVWGRAFSYETDLLPAEEAGAVQLFLLLTLAGLALLLGWAVVRSRRWWVVLLLTLPPLLPGLLADLYPDWLPFMALAACWCAMLLTSLCRWAAPDRRGQLTLITLSAVSLALALITALFPREGYTRPAWARKAEDDLRNLTSHLSDYFPHWNNSPFKTTVTYVGAAEEADLAHAGPLNYTGRTVLRVTSGCGGWMYLRGSSLAVYEDGVWKALPDGTYEAYRSEHEFETSPLYLPAMQPQDSPVYSVTVDNVGAVGSCVYAPYFPLPQDVDETGMLPVEDAYFARKQGQWSHTMTFVERTPLTMTFVDQTPQTILDVGDYRPGDGSGGTIIFYGSNGEAVTVNGSSGETYTAYNGGSGPAASAAWSYSEYVYANYLDVPEDLRETLEAYVRLATGNGSLGVYYSADRRIQTAEQFSAYLDDICEYDDSAPAAPEGVDPVYYFLTESRRGYCMHYASAVTLMLRSAGIPARYVSGFKTEILPNRRTDVPDRAAHAWVEVWIDGFGWYPVEATPDAAFYWMDQSGILDPDDPSTVPPELTPEPTDTPEPTAAPEPTASLPGSGGGPDGPEQNKSGLDLSALLPALKGIARVLGAVFLVWAVQFAVKHLRARRMAGADANRSALVCYGYLCRLERLGGKIDPRAVELAQKARFSQHTLTEEELRFLRDLVDWERTMLCMASRLPMRLVWRYWWGLPRQSVPPKQEE